MHELCLRKVLELSALPSGEEHESLQVRDIIRSKITKVTISQGQTTDDHNAVMYGDLATILNACVQVRLSKSEGSQLPDRNLPGSQLSMVAGARFELTTFRL